MKKIDTSSVTSNNWLALLANAQGKNFMNNPGNAALAGIDFLQQAYTECLQAICEGLIENDTVPTWIWDQTSGEDAEGWVYYQGEIFYVPTQDTGGLPYCNIVTSYSTSDPTPLSGSGTTNAHVIRTIQFVGTGPGTFPAYANWQSLATNAVWSATLSKGTATPITYINGYSHLDYTSTNASTYRKDGMGNVYISAYFSSPGSITSKIIATLPTGYFPLNPRNFFLWEQTGGTVCVITIDTSGNISAQTLAGGNVPGSDTFSFEAIYNLLDA
jgi:hypothetical protein